MAITAQVLTETFNRFFNSEKSSGKLLIVVTVLSLVVTNSPLGAAYIGFWQITLLGLSLEHWINDALMAIFFLLIGLELERELYVGELSSLKSALLPMVAAIGGMIVPALIHYSLNAGSAMQDGIGIPMATDIASALGVLALLGKRLPVNPQSICVHGDNADAVATAKAIREGLQRAGYQLATIPELLAGE